MDQRRRGGNCVGAHIDRGGDSDPHDIMGQKVLLINTWSSCRKRVSVNVKDL